MPHDFAAQKSETQSVYEDLQSKNDLPDMADIDYFFIASSEGADWRPLADVLSRHGFECEYVEDDAEPAYLVATVHGQALSAEGIWISEEVATQHALEYGYVPDGWGFEA